ncbi:uracil-DNA glycosylase [bacterium]|nr:uracil-DNA glycosylase [bacterium]
MAKKKAPAATASIFDAEPPAERPADVPGLPDDLPASWKAALEPETHKPYWADLMRFVAAERAAHAVMPPAADVFNAFKFTPLDEVKLLLLGQDPYPTPGVAHGLCFSVLPGVKIPQSLKNVYRELQDDVGATPVTHGYLAAWARQGVLMLNACLTVRANAPNSHAGKGWEKFTDAAIRAVNDRAGPAVFLLWGSYAQKKTKLIDAERHTVIKGVHPSPLSASNGFFGSRPFSAVNTALEEHGVTPIDWQLPDKPE